MELLVVKQKIAQRRKLEMLAVAQKIAQEDGEL